MKRKKSKKYPKENMRYQSPFNNENLVKQNKFPETSGITLNLIRDYK